MAYATGKFSYGLCDYCGQRYPYNVLRKNWRGFKVCPEDYEPKEPQLEPLKYKGDAIALNQPRPDRIEPVTIFLGGPGDSLFQSIGGAYNTTNMQPLPETQPIVALGSVGTVAVVIEEFLGSSLDLNFSSMDESYRTGETLNMDFITQFYAVWTAPTNPQGSYEILVADTI